MKNVKLWELQHAKERVSIMDIYKSVLSEAEYADETADKFEGHSSKAVWSAVRDLLYQFAAILENTEEVNTKKKATSPEVA